MNPVDATLLGTLAMVGGTFGVAWLVMGMGMRIAPAAAVRLALANLFIAVSLLLVVRRTAEPSYWYYQFADWLTLLGLTAFFSGATYLASNRLPGIGRRLTPAALAVLLTAGVAPDPSSTHIMAIAFCGAASVLAFSTIVSCWRGLRDADFSVAVRVLIVWPFAMTAVVMLGRLLQILLTNSSASSAQPEDAQTYAAFLWAMVFMTLVINLSMTALAGTRLVTRIRNLAERDHLTHCWNRRVMQDRMGIEFERNRRNGEPVSCVFLDVDHFKRINDTFGHEAGDSALKHVVDVVASPLRAQDVLGRWGGEEFVVILPGTHLTGAREAANRMRQALEGNPLTWQSASIPMTASFGVSTLGTNETVDDLIQRADRAMYLAKRNGRNRVEVATEATES